MPAFVSLKSFKSLYEKQADLLTDKGYEAFLKQLKGNEGSRIAQEQNIAPADFQHFQQEISIAQNVLFHGWIEQDDALLEFLITGKPGWYLDKANALQHRLSNPFRAFVSPYLANRLLAVELPNIDALHQLTSYLDLLDNEHRAVVESQLYKPIRKKINELVELAGVIEEEEELTRRVHPICAENYTESINALSKASYASKRHYVDGVLSVINSSGCTVRLANWILKQLENIELNNEHNEKIQELRYSLRKGELKVRNTGRGKTPVKWSSIIFITLFLFLFAGVFYVIYFKPFSDPGEMEQVSSSSFKQFSVEERKHIDSLLKEMSGTLQPQKAHQNNSFIGDLAPNNHAPLPNRLMDKIYRDLSCDAGLKEQFPLVDCADEVGFKRYPGVLNLSQKTGALKTEFVNESSMDVIVYAAESSTGGKVYSQLIKSGEKIDFKLNRFDLVTVVMGNHFTSYKAPAGALSEALPSQGYQHHFCETDGAFSESVNTTLQIIDASNGHAKFIARRTTSGGFGLDDVYGAAKNY